MSWLQALFMSYRRAGGLSQETRGCPEQEICGLRHLLRQMMQALDPRIQLSILCSRYLSQLEQLMPPEPVISGVGEAGIGVVPGRSSMAMHVDALSGGLRGRRARHRRAGRADHLQLDGRALRPARDGPRRAARHHAQPGPGRVDRARRGFGDDRCRPSRAGGRRGPLPPCRGRHRGPAAVRDDARPGHRDDVVVPARRVRGTRTGRRTPPASRSSPSATPPSTGIRVRP